MFFEFDINKSMLKYWKRYDESMEDYITGFFFFLIFIFLFMSLYVRTSKYFLLGVIVSFCCLIKAGLGIIACLKKRNMTVLDELCADVPRCFNISLGNKEIAKRIMLAKNKGHKKSIEKHFDEWVISCVRNKLIK